MHSSVQNHIGMTILAPYSSIQLTSEQRPVGEGDENSTVTGKAAFFPGMEGNSDLATSVQAGSSTKKNIYGHFSEVSQLLRGFRVLLVNERILGWKKTLSEGLEEILSGLFDKDKYSY